MLFAVNIVARASSASDVKQLVKQKGKRKRIPLPTPRRYIDCMLHKYLSSGSFTVRPLILGQMDVEADWIRS
jgi:hypothetical protein